jgi:glycosyltransferase involved in cell wall biosynthesis
MIQFSVVTVCFNSAKTIQHTLESVSKQEYSNLEHVIVDGKSSDETLDIVKTFGLKVSSVISEKDNGIYDAMNKGFLLSCGEIIGFLNSDDRYSDNKVISEIAALFDSPEVDFVYANIDMLDQSGHVSRRWRVGQLSEKGLDGNQIPHPAFFVRKEALLKLKFPFDPSYKISADLKQQLELINKLRLKGRYLDRSIVQMSLGGASTNSFSSYLRGWIESARAYNEVFGSGGSIFTARKVFSKIRGFRPRLFK